MYARVTSVQISPDHVDEATRLTRDIIIPAAQREKGFKGYMVLGDRAMGKSLSITFWETAADMQASGPGSEYYREVMARIAPLFTAPPVVDNLEVIVQV
jgi:quinol monooxygenase YgiN